MNSIVPVITICVLIVVPINSQEIYSNKAQWCKTSGDVIADYQTAVYQFAVESYKHIGTNVLKHFAFSPLSVWIVLAAFAEGSDVTTKRDMFKFLNLPEDPCVRLRYYQLATSRYVTNRDINITNTRALVINEGVKINPVYHNIVFQNSLIDMVSAPIRNNPLVALEEIRRIMSAKLPSLDMSGNSLIIDATDYNGYWSTAFEDAIIEISPFYSQKGDQIGSVDLMKVKMRAKMSYVRSMNVKFLELPVGYNGHYRMIFGRALDNDNIEIALNNFQIPVLQEYLKGLQESISPIDIAIPRISITSEHDVRKILEDFGVKKLWKDPTVTGYMSDPAALPSTYAQRSTISLNKVGFRPAPNTQPSNNASTGLDPILGRDFIANKPFFMGLFDGETYSCIMSAIFSQPTYTN